MYKKTLLALLPLLFCSLFTVAQTQWVTMKLDDAVSVKFPAQPVKKPRNAYAYTNKDSTVVLVLEIHTQGDSDPRDSSVLDDFFKNNDHVEVTPADLTSDAGQWNGYPTITTGMTLGTRKFYTHSVILKGKGYMLGAILSGKADVKIKDDFFASVTLNK